MVGEVLTSRLVSPKLQPRHPLAGLLFYCDQPEGLSKDSGLTCRPGSGQALSSVAILNNPVVTMPGQVILRAAPSTVINQTDWNRKKLMSLMPKPVSVRACRMIEIC